MKHLFFLAIALCFSAWLRFLSKPVYYSDPFTKFKEAKEYFQKEQYSLAYPLFKELKQSVRETDKVNNPVTVQEINYYTIACALKQGEARQKKKRSIILTLKRTPPEFR